MLEPTQKLNKLLVKVEEIIEEQKKLEKKEEVILATVTTDEKEDEQIESTVTLDAAELKEVAKKHTLGSEFQLVLLKRLNKHEFIFSLLVIIGVVLVWRGLWGLFDQLPIISYSFISLIVGLAILWVFNRMKSL